MGLKTLQSNDKENYSTSGNLTKRINIHEINKGNNKITELRAILQRESQNS